MNEPATGQSPMALAIDIALNLLIVFAILTWCAYILSPFITLIVWGGIIAIAIYPAYLRLREMLGDRGKLAVTVVALIGAAIVIAPLWSFTGSTIETAIDLRARVAEGELVVPPAPETVRDWPVIGERVHAVWTDAATNLSGFVEEHNAQIRNVAVAVLTRLAGAGLGALQFLVSIVIAAAFLHFAQGAIAAMRTLFKRLAGDDGEELMTLSVATIRSVAVGVLGIAAIQALLSGLGMVAVGVPAAGVWTLLVLLVAIVQLPPLLVLLPIIIYVFSVETTAVASIFAIWSFLVGFSDTFLKPVFLGRGVDAPMIVILLGAIGGMITSGIIGLFVGGVVLAVSFKLLQRWLSVEATHPAAAEPTQGTA
jgi:predicted PurR-regulated permease PerM